MATTRAKTKTTTKTRTSRAKGLDFKGALTRKFGPLPAWAWLGILAVVVYLWRRRAAAQASGGGSGSVDTGLGSGSGFDDSGLGGSGSGGSAGVGDTAAGFPSGGTGVQVAPVGGFGTVPFSTSDGNGTGSSPASAPQTAGLAARQQNAAALKVAQARVPASSPDFAAAEQAKTAAAKQAGVPVAFGGVQSVKTLNNGATLTTFESGRQVEQAPGKSAYVTKAGPSANPPPRNTAPVGNAHRPGVQM